MNKKKFVFAATWLMFESLYYLLQFGLAGVVIALIYGKRMSHS